MIKIKITVVLFFMAFISMHAQNIDSLKLVVTKQEGAQKIKTLNDLCWYLGGTEKNEAANYGKESISISKKIGNDTLLAQAYNDYGTLFLRYGDYDSAQHYYSSSLEIRVALKDTNGIASLNSKLAVMFEVKGDYEKSLKYNFEVLRIYEAQGKERNVGILKGNIAVIYYNLHQYNLALKFNKEVEFIAKKLNDEYLYRSAYSTYGNIYTFNNKRDSAIIFFKMAIPYIEKSNDNNALSAVYNNIGNNFQVIGNLDEAEIYLKKALDIRISLNDKKGLSSSYSVLAEVALKKNNIKDALEYNDIAYKIANEIGVKEGIKNALGNYIKIYSELNEWEKVVHYQNEFIIIKDSIFNENMNNQIAEMESKYESDKKDASIKLLNKDNLLKEANIEKQKQQKYIVYGGLAIALLFSFFIYNRLQITKKQKNIIEEQSLALTEANEELNQTNEEILAQRDQIEIQKERIEHAHNEVKASISYAERIQKALLSSDDSWDKIGTENFVLFKPRDVVSGDFFWAYSSDEYAIWAAADCTGHGVPGAFMSMLGIGLLNEIVAEGGETNSGNILNKLRSKIINSLHQKGDEQRKDGMDIALCVLNKKTLVLQFSGAYNPLLIIRKNSVKEPINYARKVENSIYNLYDFKADKMPIGKFILDNKPFSTQEIQLYKDDSIYTFSDGFQDQFGGIEQKKYMIKNLKEYLIQIQNESMLNQHNLLNTEFENYLKAGFSEQIDDVCIVGVKI